MLAALMLPMFAFTGAYIGDEAIKDDDPSVEDRKLLRVLIPWALFAVLASAWVASARPFTF